MVNVLAQDLRDAVLQAAMQGKLTEQLPEDGNAYDLLNQIKAEKESLIKAKAIKKAKELSPLIEEAPFNIPDNWIWSRIGTVLTLQAGKNTNSSSIKDEPSEKYCFACYGGNGIRGYKDVYNTEGFHAIVGRQGALCGNINYADGQFYATEHAVVVYAYAETNMACVGLFLEALNLNQYATATAQPGLSVEKINTTPFPLPPIGEQARIVSCVKELMEKIDEYEKLENELAKLKQRFPGEMKKAILQAVMQGKASEHYESDEDIDLYCARVMEEQRVCSKKDSTEEDDGNYPFDIPNHWKWIRLNHLVAKEIRRGKSPKYASSGSALAFAQKCNSKYTGIRLDLAQFLDEDSLARYSDIDNMANNDIVVNSTGGGTLGRVGLYKDVYNSEGRRIYPDSHVTVVRAKKTVCPEYLYYCLKYYGPYLETLGEGSTNQTELKPATLKNLYIPFPPIEEQQRIVDKLDSLLPLCDELAELA